MTKRIYADYNATAPLRAEAKAALLEALALEGNASSLHSEGRKAKAVMDSARRIISTGFGIKTSDVFFTSSATEAANWALMPALALKGVKPSRLLYSAGEHPAIKEGSGFKEAIQLPLLKTGIVNLAVLEEILQDEMPSLIAIQAANNETGVIQPIQEIARLAHHYNALFLCDAVQAIGKMPLHSLIGADAVIISAHKFGGAKGAGALLLTSPRVSLIDAFIKGGGQEARRRSGTENIAAIAAFGAAFSVANVGDNALQTAFEAGLIGEIVGASVPRLNNTTCVILPVLKAEMALIKLDLKGIAISSGSACSSGKIKPSETLLAMGYSEAEAERALRISFGAQSTLEEALIIQKAINSL